MRRPKRIILGAVVVLLAASCGHARSELVVFAAASLTAPFTASEYPGLSVTYSFAGSQQLVAQITAGAPADVVATADQDTMARLVATNLVEPPTTFAQNTLQVAVAPRNPKAITALSDLARPGLKVVLADPSVPAGRYAVQALDKAGITVRPVSLELNVTAALGKVTSGEADAAVVYVTDVAGAKGAVTGIDIPPAHNIVASYPVAVVRATRNPVAARAFVDQLLHGPGRDALRAHGFLGV